MKSIQPFEWGDKRYYYSADHHKIFTQPEIVTSPQSFPDRKPTGVHIRNLYLNLTNGCNLKCEYCFTPASTPALKGNMSQEIIRASIIRLAKSWAGYRGSASAAITFFGGEPLLNRDGLQHAVYFSQEWSREYGVPFSYSISTNGTLVTGDDIEFFRDKGIFVWFSIDGPAEIHDRRRGFRGNKKSSHALAIKHALDTLKSMPDGRVGVRATLSSGGTKLSGIIDYLAKQGFKVISTSGVEPNQKSKCSLGPDDLKLLENDLDDCVRVLLHWRQRGLRSFPLDQDLASLEKGPAGRFMCDAGRGSLTVDPNGWVYPCHRFVGDPKYNLGNILGGKIDLKPCEEFAKLEYSRISGCSSCWARKFCLGCCPGTSVAAGNPPGHPHSQHCKERKLYATLSLKCAVAENRGMQL